MVPLARRNIVCSNPKKESGFKHVWRAGSFYYIISDFIKKGEKKTPRVPNILNHLYVLLLNHQAHFFINGRRVTNCLFQTGTSAEVECPV